MQSLAAIENDFFVKCYGVYNRGQDDFPKETEDIFWDLMDHYEVDEGALAKL